MPAMLPPGTRLGPYEIGSSLGAGGMGEVYRARDPKLGREVAIKVLPTDMGGRPDALARFEREARAVAALSHPNILAIHDFGNADGTAFAVMELLEGTSLREVLSNGPLPSRKALAYAVQIADGLAAAHDKGIVHRDLKPDNVFVTPDDRVKILDFGLARRDEPGAPGSGSMAPTLDSPTEPGVVLGTVGYMAPEQARGAAVDARADIFALGVVLFEMVTGRRAFQRDSTAETLTAIIREDLPEFPPERAIGPAVERIIRHCVEKKPEARFRSASDLAFALETAAGASTPSASSTAATAAADRTFRIGRAGRLTAGALVVGLALAAGALLARRTASPAATDVAREPPTFRRLSFGRGPILGARFAPDGQTVLYSGASGAAEPRLVMTRLESPGATLLALPPAILFAVSSSTELALGLDSTRQGLLIDSSTLSQAPMLGGAARRIADGVTAADWSPDGTRLAVVRTVGSRQRLEFPLGRTVLETDGEIGKVRVSPSGDRLAILDWPVKNDDRGSVAVVDLTGAKRTISRTWEALSTLAWTPDGREVWYSALAQGASEYAIWGSTLEGRERQVYSAPGSVLIQDVQKDGRSLIARYEPSALVMGARAGQPDERELGWLDRSFARDLSPDLARVLLTYSGAGGGVNYSVFVRGFDTADATRIGEGEAQQFSPDGRWVLSIVHGPPPKLLVLPVGAGDLKVVSTGAVVVTAARWLPDGRRLLIIGTEAGKGARAYLTDVDGSAPRPVSPEGITHRPNMLLISPDGMWVILNSPEGLLVLYPTSGGDPRPVNGLEPTEVPVGWSGDSRALFVATAPAARRIVRLDPASGRRETVREIRPGDASLSGPSVMVSPDGRSYVANYGRIQMTLFVAEGLR